MVSIKWVLAAVAVVLAAWGVVVGLGRWRWADATDALTRSLQAQRGEAAPARYDPGELEGLPEPVQRYFRAVLTPGQPIVIAATLAHRGEFDMGEAQPNWKPFTSEQRIVAGAPGRPGFVWDARIAFVPGIAMRVHDAYVAGAGHLRAALAGLVTVAEPDPTPELAAGELMRYLAEAAWVPTALLPSQGVRWEPVDERSARATFADGSTRVTLTFHFAGDSTIESVRAEARGRGVGGRTVPTPWEGRWTDFQAQGGLRVPMSGEVAWLTPEGRRVYWRGTVTSARYEFAQ